MACTAWPYILGTILYQGSSFPVHLHLRRGMHSRFALAHLHLLRISLKPYFSQREKDMMMTMMMTHSFTTASDKLATRPRNFRNCYPLIGIHTPATSFHENCSGDGNACWAAWLVVQIYAWYRLRLICCRRESLVKMPHKNQINDRWTIGENINQGEKFRVYLGVKSCEVFLCF